MNLINKKLISLMACSAILSSGFAFANDGAMGSHDTPKEFTVQIEEKVLVGAKPIIKEDRTLLPFRVLFEGLGAEVEYDAATKTIEAMMGGKDIKMKIGSKSATVSGQPFNLAVAPLVESNVTYIPLRDVANISGLTADYSALQKKINIYDRDALIKKIDSNFKIYNTILQNSDKNQMNKVFKSNVNMTGNVEFYDNGNIKKADGALKFDGLSRGMDLNGAFDLKLNLDSFEKDVTAGMSAEEMKLFKDILFSKHQIIMDSKNALLYIQSDALASLMGAEKATWFKISGQSIEGMDQIMTMMNSGYLVDLMNNPKEATLGKVLYESTKAQADMMMQQGLSSYMPTIYDQVDMSVQMLSVLMGDDGFTQNGKVYTMDLDKKALAQRITKFAPESAGDINAVLNSISALNYKVVLENIDSKDAKMQMLVKGSAKTSDGEAPFSMDIKSTGNAAAKIDFSISMPKMGKMVFSMDAISAETSQSIRLTPPAGSVIQDLS